MMWEAWLPHIVANFCHTTFIVALSLVDSWHVIKGYGRYHDFKASSLGIFNCHITINHLLVICCTAGELY